MKPFKTLIVEDNRDTLEELLEYIKYDNPTLEVSCIAENCSEALDALIEGTFEISILDIELPDGRCFDILSKVPRHKFGEIVFFTKYGGKYITQLIDAKPIGYLAKPIAKLRVQEMLLQIEDYLSKKAQPANYIKLFKNITGTRVLVNKENILYIEKRFGKNYFHYREPNPKYPEKEADKYLYPEAIGGDVLHKELERLDNNFVQCSQTCILNLSYFNEYEPISKGDNKLNPKKEILKVLMPNGKSIEISKGYKNEVLKRKGIS